LRTNSRHGVWSPMIESNDSLANAFLGNLPTFPFLLAARSFNCVYWITVGAPGVWHRMGNVSLEDTMEQGGIDCDFVFGYTNALATECSTFQVGKDLLQAADRFGYTMVKALIIECTIAKRICQCRECGRMPSCLHSPFRVLVWKKQRCAL
jgi:hypothetical protein